MLTLGYFTTLVGVEPSHELVSSPLKVEIQANIGFVDKKIVYKVSDSVIVVFTKCENTGIESFFVSPKTIC
jgi:hypothetical protein